MLTFCMVVRTVIGFLIPVFFFSFSFWLHWVFVAVHGLLSICSLWA